MPLLQNEGFISAVVLQKASTRRWGSWRMSRLATLIGASDRVWGVFK